MSEPKPTDPNVIDIDEFVNMYVNFTKKLAAAEKAAELDIVLTTAFDLEQRIDLFRFWYMDKRNQEDIAREIEELRLHRLQHEDDDEDDGNKKEFWEED